MKKIGMLLIAFLLTTSCSHSTEETAKKTKEETKEKKDVKQKEKTPQEKPQQVTFNRELTDTEKMMMKPPGKYSGKYYDEEKVKKELDKFPKDLSKEEYLDRLLLLLAEDYRPHVPVFVNFDSSVEVNHEKPTNDITLPETKKMHFSILLDTSGSMAGKVDGKTKMDAAKEAIESFSSSLPKNASVSLRVYGHKGSNEEADKALSCGATETIYSATGHDESALKQALSTIQPTGWTPIASALQGVKEDIPEGTTEAIVYVVSDGIETCDGDPVQAAKDLNSIPNIKTVVNIIGFDVDDDGQKQLKDVANAGAGEFISVDDERALNDYLRDQYEKLQKQWLEWKESGQKEAYEQKEQKKALATHTKEMIKELSETEKENLKKAQEYLKEKIGEDLDHPIRDTYWPITDRSSEIWSYAVDTGGKLWSDSVNNGNDKWSEITEEGNDQISDAIDKKNGN